MEAAIDDRVKNLTNITVTSMERGECNIAGTLEVVRALGDHDLKCYFMDFSGDFVEKVSGGSIKY